MGCDAADKRNLSFPGTLGFFGRSWAALGRPGRARGWSQSGAKKKKAGIAKTVTKLKEIQRLLLFLATLGSHLGRCSGLLGWSWAALGRSWAGLRRLLASLGRVWAALGRFGSLLARSWPLLGKFGSDLGAVLGLSGCLLDPSWPLLAGLGPVFADPFCPGGPEARRVTNKRGREREEGGQE